MHCGVCYSLCYQSILHLLKFISEKSEINELCMPVALAKTFLRHYDLESGMPFGDKKSQISIVSFISCDFQQSFPKGV